MAGVVGIDPGGLTLGQLATMHDGKCRDAWNHTSAVLATLYNAGGRLKRPVEPSRFHPFAQPRRRGIPITAANITDLKAML